MKKSYYSIHVKDKITEDVILLHGYSGAIDVIGIELSDLIKSDKFEKIPNETIRYLVSRGHITTKTDNDEKKIAQRLAQKMHHFNISIGKSILFLVTYDCSFACPYCFENSISDNGRNWTGEILTEDIADIAFKAALEYKPDLNYITLYGGEPLMKKNVKYVEYILKKGEKLGISFGAITNAFEINEYISYFDKKGNGKITSIQVTLDGPKTAHDSRRVPLDMTPSFDKIVKNIGMVLMTGCHVSVRVNTDQKNINDLGELLPIIKSEKWNTFENFSIYVSAVNANNSTNYLKNQNRFTKSCHPSSMDAFDKIIPINEIKGMSKNKDIPIIQHGKFLKKMFKLQEDNEEFRVIPSDKDITKIFTRIFTGDGFLPYKTSYCSANTGMVILDPKGDVYSCWETVGKSEFVIGSFKKNSKIEILNTHKKNWLGRYAAEYEPCKSCQYMFFCGGGCQALAQEGNMTPFSSYCEHLPLTVRESLLVAYRRFLKNVKMKARIKVNDVDNLCIPDLKLSNEKIKKLIKDVEKELN